MLARLLMAWWQVIIEDIGTVGLAISGLSILAGLVLGVMEVIDWVLGPRRTKAMKAMMKGLGR